MNFNYSGLHIAFTRDGRRHYWQAEREQGRGIYIHLWMLWESEHAEVSARG